jgi:hypothetical protein
VSISLADQIACVEREIKMRERVYPNWVTRGTMTEANARKEIHRMRAALETLQKLDGIESLFPPEEDQEK